MKALKSWKTTAVAIIGGLIIILTALSALLDGNPETTVNTGEVMTAIGTIFGVIGVGWFARDNDKSSESVGAKPKPKVSP